MSNASTLFNLTEGQEIRLNGLTFVKVVSIGQPILKATLDAQMLNGDERCIYNHNTDNWDTLESLDSIVIGIGDKILIGDVMVMMTNLSSKRGTVRLSLRTDNPQTFNSIRKAVGK